MGMHDDVRWLLVQFVADLHRQESVNVGVLVESEHGRAARFRGADAGGVVDARWVQWTDAANWQNWILYWQDRFLVEQVALDDMVDNRPSCNFRVIPGGRMKVRPPLNGSLDAIADERYGKLVAPPGRR